MQLPHRHAQELLARVTVAFHGGVVHREKRQRSQEEEDHVLVLAEMPGVSAEDVKITVEDDLLTISAERGDKKYRKEVLLPASTTREKTHVTCNNGVVEIRCRR